MNTVIKKQGIAAQEKGVSKSAPVGESRGRVQLKRSLRGLSYSEGAIAVKPAVQKQEDKIDAGTAGMITEETKAKGVGGEVTLQEGHFVEVVEDKGKELVVKAWSGLAGIQVTIDKKLFKAQPGLTTHDHDENPDTPEVPQAYKYKDFSPEKKEDALTPGGREPSVSDVSQGAIGDCYLMAGMGAVAAARPDLIRKMVSYDEKTKTYTVTFKELQWDRKTFKDVKITVDAFLPAQFGSPKYAQDSLVNPKDTAIWPAIIEKAYAKWKGGYQDIVGGSPGKAMEVITGGKSDYQSMPREEDVIKVFQSFEKDKKIVCCGTVDYIDEKATKVFSGSAPGPFTATLKGSGEKPAQIVKNSLEIIDTGGKAGSAHDDGRGGITGSDVKEGKVTYKGGFVTVTYKSEEKSPGKPEDLEARYRYERLISDALNLYGNHAYMFVRVEGDKLIFANPWGPDPSYQPKPIGARDFLKYFESLSVNTPPPKEME